MNLLELQSRVLSRSRRDNHDSHRRQLARDLINDKIQEILSRSTAWPFLHSTAEIDTVAATSLYTLPYDFAVLESCYLDSVRQEVFRTGIEDRYNDDVIPSFGGVTIRRLSSSSLASTGTVYPTFNSDTVTGIGTSFESSFVDRFFKSARDGEIYRIKSVTSSTEIVLSSEYGGKSQAGLVSVYATDPTQVHGNVGVTNFSEDMINRRIQIEGNGTTTFVINAVDETNQILTISAASATGVDLIYSVQDSFEIDPAGCPILYITPDTSAGSIIQVDYIAKAIPLTSPTDIPIIPDQFHWVIAAGAQADFMAIDAGDPQTISFLGGRFERGVASIMAYDPLEGSNTQSVEPDTVRLRSRNRAR